MPSTNLERPGDQSPVMVGRNHVSALTELTALQWVLFPPPVGTAVVLDRENPDAPKGPTLLWVSIRT